MQDRIPLYPGRVKLTPVSGQENTYDMVRADEPTQVGTALSKANLLKDTTAALYGLDETATPDEVLAKIHENVAALDTFEVGDTLATVRTDLGDKWLLCNGESMSPDDYPDLNGRFSLSPTGKTIDNSMEASDEVRVAYYGGTYVAVCTDGSGYPYAFIATAPLGDWAQKKMSSTAVRLKNIACYNGTWVAVGYSNSGTKPYMYVSTDPAGAWTAVNPSSTVLRLYDVACCDGTWVAVGYKGNSGNNSAYLYTTTDPTGTWTGIDLSSLGTNLYSVACYNGLWVATGKSGGLSCVLTTTDPTGTWTVNVLPTEDDDNLYAIACYNGTWVAVGTSAYIYTTTDPTGEWAKNEASVPMYDVACCDGTWVAVGYTSGHIPYIVTTTDPTGTWRERKVSATTTLLYGIANNGNTYVAAGRLYSNDCPRIFTNEEVLLPTISVDGVYTYIKAKE